MLGSSTTVRGSPLLKTGRTPAWWWLTATARLSAFACPSCEQALYVVDEMSYIYHPAFSSIGSTEACSGLKNQGICIQLREIGAIFNTIDFLICNS